MPFDRRVVRSRETQKMPGRLDIIFKNSLLTSSFFATLTKKGFLPVYLYSDKNCREQEVLSGLKEFKEKAWDACRDWGVPFILTLIFSISIYFMVTYHARNSARSVAEEEIQTAWEAYTEQLSVRLDQLFLSGATASLMAETVDGMAVEDMQKIAAVVKKAAESTSVLFSDVNGNAVSDEGKQVTLLLEDFGVSQHKESLERWYAFAPEASDEITEITGNTLCAIIPVCHEDEREAYAYLICMEDISESFRDVENENLDTAYQAIVDKSGKGLVFSGAVSENAQEDIWLDLAEGTGQNELGIKKKLSTVRTLSMYAKNGDVYYIIPSKTADDMYLVVKVMKSAVESKVRREARKLQMLMRSLEVLTAAFIVLFVVYSWFRHNISVKNTEKLEKSATTDPLTGLKNKATMEREIREYMQQNPEDEGVMFLLDIDDFKSVNDTKGHAFGDLVLKEFSFRLSNYFRAADFIGRIGGDEFMVFCPHFSDEAAIAYKIESLEKFAKTFSVGTVMIQKVSCSIGLAYYPKDGADFESLYKAADQAMYRSKKGGKARVSI